jgi:hypothetical protein
MLMQLYAFTIIKLLNWILLLLLLNMINLKNLSLNPNAMHLEKNIDKIDGELFTNPYFANHIELLSKIREELDVFIAELMMEQIVDKINEELFTNPYFADSTELSSKQREYLDSLIAKLIAETIIDWNIMISARSDAISLLEKGMVKIGWNILLTKLFELKQKDDIINSLQKENEDLKDKIYLLEQQINKLLPQPEIVTEPIKKEYKNCKRCLDKHTSENELCDECIKNT